MFENKVYRAIGLMSGTSLDGVIDVALIETDGHDYVKPLRFFTHAYDDCVCDAVRACFGKKTRDAQVDEAEHLVTEAHIAAVKAFGEDADIIGVHGQTITHDPDHGFTWQIGNGQKLANSTDVQVVYDMRQADVKAGGQGAPLLPLYHRALLQKLDKNVAVLNLGGVANITYVGSDGQLIAFDCGPANALMDDFMRERRGLPYDKGGRIASQGTASDNVIEAFIADSFFIKRPPKSLDRDHWNIDCVRYASVEDGMATLLEMTVRGVRAALDYLPELPSHIYVAGGGRHNHYLIATLVQRLGIPITPMDDLGFNGDATEAEGFAYLAVRALLGLPLSLPTTTGVREAVTGGILSHK